MLKEYDGLSDVGSRYVLECRCKKIGEDGSEICACDDTVNPVSGLFMPRMKNRLSTTV